MKKNKTSSRSSFFKTTLLVLMASSFSISNSYGRSELIKKDNYDSIPFKVQHSIAQTTWNRDVKNTHIKIKLILDKEDLAKSLHSFLFFRFCKKPDEMWFFGGDGVWKKYNEGEAPSAYDYKNRTPSTIPLGASLIPFMSMNTGNPIDISPMVNSPW